MNTDWTKEQAAAWEATWNEPHMQEGLKKLKAKAKVAPVALPAGYDALVIAAGQFHEKGGAQSVLDEIESLSRPRIATKPAPQPFTREARGEQPL